MISIYYGVSDRYSNVTRIAKLKLLKDEMIIIPAGDFNRAVIFGDPVPDVEKHIKVVTMDRSQIYDQTVEIKLTVPSSTTLLTSHGDFQLSWTVEAKPLSNPASRLTWLHNNLRLVGGSFQEEYPEQLMVTTYLNEQATVLELGANIGRNTCIIASILNDDRRLVTLECDPDSAGILLQNRNLNELNFHIEVSALSKVKLAQQGWTTIEYQGDVPAGYFPVATITFLELQHRYNLQFDTIVADCEGALYQILRDEPTLLTNITTVILENDFTELTHKQFVDAELTKFDLQPMFSAGGGWGHCADYFFQVFKR
jgi:FkbM family methyltransferase